MIAVIQCASSKRPEAGYLRTGDGRRVVFVADPLRAPANPHTVHARPDDPSDSGVSWRRLLLRYNSTPGDNPLGLLPAYSLYLAQAYARLAAHVGIDRMFVLSAGWGLVSGDFLLPYYDITFAPCAKPDRYKRRRHADWYEDFEMLPDGEEIVFFGGREYVPLFCRLTEGFDARRTVFYRANHAPSAPGCVLRRYEFSACTNWHYRCVQDYVAGRLKC